MQHVILGAGPAGVIAAETLRKRVPNDRVLLIGEEDEAPYSRMAIPYLLIGQVGEQGTHLRKGDAHFQQLGIELKRLRATSVDTAARMVKLSDGTQQSYDRLLIATGARPVRPPIQGLDLPNVHTCWTLADARAIMADVKPGSRVLQMGAGFIGCIIMEALAQRVKGEGGQLTVVEMGNRMVPRMMTEKAGAMIKAWCIQQGVQVVTDAKVESLQGGGSGSGSGLLSKVVSLFSGSDGKVEAPIHAKLSNGKTIGVDVVIVATGVKPNLEFLEGSGIACKDGILVDEKMQTNVPGVYAAGDVINAVDFSTGERSLNMIQPAAADEARIAALNMCGGATASQGSLAMNVLDTLGLIASSFGQWWGADAKDGGRHVEQADDAAFKYLRLEFQGDQLIGATSLGWTNHVGVLRGLIQGKVKLGDWADKLIDDPTRVMEAYLACSQQQNAWASRASTA
ncbi:MAG: NAD(P)/FAD-dependent oxidoreductase [Pseudomonadota bacterium]